MIPIVTVCPTPSGLPTASTTSPTCTASELPNDTAWRSVASDLDEREVARLVCPDDLTFERAAVGQIDVDVVGAVHDVIVREDVAVAADDDARAETALPERARPLRTAALPLPVAELVAEEAPEEVVALELRWATPWPCRRRESSRRPAPPP